MSDTQFQIYQENFNCRATDGRASKKIWPVPAKVTFPGVFARMKKSRQLPRQRVESADVAAFERIAQRANVTRPNLTGIDPPSAFRYYRFPLF
jgi:hypothetical protein